MRWIVLTLSLLQSPSMEAATFTVDTTSDAALAGCSAAPGDCSLRGAITAANLDAMADVIAFDIPGSDSGCDAATGICRITLSSLLPDIAQDLTIDGYTQSGAKANTIEADQGGLDSEIKIELVQSGVLGGAALRACGPDPQHELLIRGLAITGGFQSGIDYYASCIATQNGTLRVEGNYIGTDATGSAALADNVAGIQIGSPFGSTSGAIIGGTQPAQRNLISGNTVGVSLLGFGHQVLGNLIGTDRSGLAAIGNALVGVNCAGGVLAHSCLIGDGSTSGRNVLSGNGGSGVSIDAGGPVRIRGNLIGANVAGAALGNGVDGVRAQGSNRGSGLPVEVGGPGDDANLIAFNGRAGILIGFPNHHVAENVFRENRNLAIWFGNPTRQLNDIGDPDGNSVGNRGQNFPEISGFSIDGGSILLDYSVDTAVANATYPLTVRFFRADGDEGIEFIGSDTYALTEAQQEKFLVLPLAPGSTLTGDDVLVATATDADGNTSEFSFHTANLVIDAPLPSPCTDTDRVYCDGFESAVGGSLSARVTAIASNGPFSPNGRVTVADDRGGTCTLTLGRTSVPGVSAGACVLAGSAGPGSIQLTATLDANASAFASAAGASVSVSATFGL